MKKIKNRLTKKKDMDFTVFEHYECDGQLSIEDIGGIMESIINISAEEIYSHPDNPRKDLGDLTELADSIKKKGIMQNLTVMKGHWDEERNWQQSGYTLLIGHRRFAAGKLAKISEFPCRVVENMEYKEQIGIMLEENMQRNDLSIFEQAQGFQMMLDLGDTEDQIAEKTGFSRTTVRHRLNIAKLDQETVKEKTEDESFQLTLRDIYELEKIKDVEERNRVLKEATSSENLAARARSAAKNERRKENEETIINMLRENGIALAPKSAEQGIYSGTWERVENYDNDKVPETLNLPKETGIYYMKSWNGINLVKKAKKEKKELSAWEKAQKEGKAKEKKLNELKKELDKKRKEFILDIVEGKDNQGVKEEKIKDAIWKVLTGLEVGIYRRTMAELFLKKGYWDSEQKDREGADQKAIELSAFGQMLAILNHGLKSDSNSPVGYMAEYKKEKGMLQLEAYRILEVYGWYFTEEEKSLLDGTHELYAKKDNK